MPKILSSFSGPDPIAQTLSSLGRQLFGGDKTASALNNEKLYAAQRENAERDNLMARVAAGGAHTLGADPTVQAILLGSGIDPAQFAEIGRMGSATGYGAEDPRTANWQVAAGQAYSSTAPAFNTTMAETRRANDLDSADKRFAVTTADATDRYKHDTLSAADALTDNTKRYGLGLEDATKRFGIETNAGIERAKPYAALDATGQPVLVPIGNAANGQYQPVLSDTDRRGTLLGQNFDNLDTLNPQQQEVLGARVTGDKAGTIKNYIFPGPDGRNGVMLTTNGVTDLSGNPLPPGGYVGTVEGGAADVGVTNAVATDMQGNVIANKKFEQLVGMGMELTKDPTLFGAQGRVRSLAQELAAGVSGMSAVLGSNVEEARSVLAQDLAPTGLDARRILPELYDPNLPKVDTVWGLLVFQGASALAGQENRSVSDKDVQAMRQILGDPKSVFASAQMMQSKLQSALEIVAINDRVAREALGGKAPVTPNAPADGLNRTTTGAAWRVVPNAAP
ncbi:hypothetical protein GGQ64_005338 [Rhizobium azooxidifex]|uniref:Uncharacterized protein n=1 Tax=Mycoplana azooxidifex TaxID=1636188 RepID=A0A7W6DB79_9HYPH|nr:hypothetical protein [Mycoplana azooxidifex]MBB3980091.1 hypothetical protein [Mycoplana azooxidifex]